jgi:hypothetical protein
MEQVYNEVASCAGTCSTHWRFYPPDTAENTPLLGSPIDAPNISLNRNARIRQRWNVKRNGSTGAAYVHTECSLNSLTTFTTLTNSCATNPVCIAPDSAKNMGDPTSNLLPNDGYIFTPGVFTVDTINTALTTSLAEGQVSEMEAAYAFNPSLANGDVVRCRLRTAGGVFDTYPSALPTITISVSAGSNLQGGSLQGVTLQ